MLAIFFFFVIDRVSDVSIFLPSQVKMLAFELVFNKKLHRLKHNE